MNDIARIDGALIDVSQYEKQIASMLEPYS